jgi:pre-mRNA cleavage complex 2 protein Pcf11
MPQDQLMIIRDRVAELAVNIRPQPPVSAGLPYTNTPTPPVVSQQPTGVPSAAAAAVAAALARPSSATPAPAAGGVSIDSIFGQGALAALISGATRKSATPQQQTPTPQPPPPAAVPAIGPAAAAAIAAALRSPPPQRPTELPRPAAAAAPPASDPSALLAMLRQSGLIKPGGTPTPSSTAPFRPGGFQSLAGAVSDANPQLRPAALKT